MKETESIFYQILALLYSKLYSILPDIFIISSNWLKCIQNEFRYYCFAELDHSISD